MNANMMAPNVKHAPTRPVSATTVSLPVELTELILVFAIRSTSTIDPRRRAHDSATIHSLLTTLPQGGTSFANRYTIRAALTQMWWVDCDFASSAVPAHCRLPLLDTMLAMHPKQRPLQYSQQGLLKAAELCDVSVIEWWYAQRTAKRLYFLSLRYDEMLQGIKLATSEQGALQLFTWFIRTHMADLTGLLHGKQTAPEQKTEEPSGTYNTSLSRQALRHGFRSLLELVDMLGWFPYDTGLSAGIADAVQGKHKWAIQWAIERYEPDEPDCWLATKAYDCGLESWDEEWVVWLHNLKVSELDRRRSRLSKDYATIVSVPSEPYVPFRGCFRIAGLTGRLDMLEWDLHNSNVLDAQGKLPRNTQIYMDQIALQGHLNVLEWWQANADRFGATLVAHDHSRRSILPSLVATRNVPVVAWWVTQQLFPNKKSDIECLPEYAAQVGLVELLDWCAANAATVKVTYSSRALGIASDNGHLNVMQWFLDHRKRITCEKGDITTTSNAGHLDCLKWWVDQGGWGLALPCDLNAVSAALDKGHLDVFEWWQNSGLLNTDYALQWGGEWNPRMIHASLVQYLAQQLVLELQSRLLATSREPHDQEDLEKLKSRFRFLVGSSPPLVLNLLLKQLAELPRFSESEYVQVLAKQAMSNRSVCLLQFLHARGHKLAPTPYEVWGWSSYLDLLQWWPDVGYFDLDISVARSRPSTEGTRWTTWVEWYDEQQAKMTG